MKHERSRWEIIFDILKATKEEEIPNKTSIMQNAYLDWRIFSRYFDFLIENGFIAQYDQQCYELTEDGQKLFNRLTEVSEMF